MVNWETLSWRVSNSFVFSLNRVASSNDRIICIVILFKLKNSMNLKLALKKQIYGKILKT